jgi:hypothetical protein
LIDVFWKRPSIDHASFKIKLAYGFMILTDLKSGVGHQHEIYLWLPVNLVFEDALQLCKKRWPVLLSACL